LPDVAPEGFQLLVGVEQVVERLQRLGAVLEPSRLLLPLDLLL
jgi:hypothetical protein